MELKKVLTCPLGHECERINAEKKIIEKCVWHINMRGTNPTSGEEIDQEGCAMAWMPILLVENSRQQRSTAAAVESFRNEMSQGNQAAAHLFATLANPINSPATMIENDGGLPQ